MKALIAPFLAGLVFSLGLAVSGMCQPAKVIGFLDPVGGWDPSLALVMIGAIGVHATAYLVASRLPRPLVDGEWKVPAGFPIDRRLVGGALLFGLGWGLGGVCPGPALTALMGGSLQMVVFVGAMVAGMAGFDLWEKATLQVDG
jgi:uncharacterized membrane protein YedE/YeeE